jgi:allophanate hydrolase subunit 1
MQAHCSKNESIPDLYPTRTKSFPNSWSRIDPPQGAVGIAGVVAAIYPIVSPGGYMMYGRSLPAWQQWGKGPNFTPDRPWLLHPFDQVRVSIEYHFIWLRELC